VWDSNNAVVSGAVIASEYYERLYQGLRKGVVAVATSTSSAYKTAKSAAAGTQHHLLLPVRDWVIMPSFHLAEKSATAVYTFGTSPQLTSATNKVLDGVER
jgi:hypothetical protein